MHLQKVVRQCVQWITYNSMACFGAARDEGQHCLAFVVFVQIKCSVCALMPYFVLCSQNARSRNSKLIPTGKRNSG